MVKPFLIDGIFHPYSFSKESLRGRFGRIHNGILRSPASEPAIRSGGVG